MAPKKPPTPTGEAAEEPKEEEVAAEVLNGDFIFKDGTMYKGQYLKKGDDVCIHGEGALQSGPESFKGTFENGLYKSGRYTSCNGAVYTGTFKNNLFDGLGEYHWPDGRAYKGTWKEGKMHGRGQFQNFSFGADKEFRGFSVGGNFCSDGAAQAEASNQFLAEYRDIEYVPLAKELLQKLGAGEVPQDFFVPAMPELQDVSPEAKVAREARGAIEEMVRPPFPAKEGVTPELLKRLVDGLAEGAEPPLQVRVLVDKSDATCIDAHRIRNEQLQHVGQVVEFIAQDAEGGTFAKMVIMNVGSEYECSKAVWKIVSAEEAPQPAT